MKLQISCPANGNSDFSVQAPCDNVTYTFRFKWNERSERWYLDLLEDDGVTPILLGLAVIVNQSIASNLVEMTMPGWLFFVEIAGGGIDPDFDGLNKQVPMVYVTADERKEALAA